MNDTVDVYLHCTCGPEQRHSLVTYRHMADEVCQDWILQHDGSSCAPTATKQARLVSSAHPVDAWAWVDAKLAEVDAWIAAKGKAA